MVLRKSPVLLNLLWDNYSCMHNHYHKILLYLPSCIKNKLDIILITLAVLECCTSLLQTNFMSSG